MNLFSFIKQKLSILEVINEYVTLKKAGNYYKGHCPFHHERTASFSVSPDKGIFYCFGCHTGGDLISFIAKVEHCSQLEAAHHVIERYALQIPNHENLAQLDTHQREKQHHTTVCTVTAQWCHKQLLEGKQPLDYMRQRAITLSTVTDFMAGYFPSGSRSLRALLAYGQKHGILAKDLLAAGILVEGKSGLYSPFEERIIFPIKDHLGRICGFGGRIFKELDERPKYYNSQDHPFFSKGSLLFGLDRAKKNIQQKEYAFLVEGYIDVITMTQHGYTNTIATLGTACTYEHLKQLSRYVSKIYILYDGDTAGQKAIIRLIELCWHVSIDLYVITLPPSHDPASFLYNKGDLEPHIAAATDIFTFFITYMGVDFGKKSLQERIRLTKQCVTTIGHLEDPLKQDLLLQKAAQVFAIPFETLKQELGRNRNSKQPLPKPVQAAQSGNSSTPDTPNDNNYNEKKQLNKISQLEKNLFSAILSYREVLMAEDEELLKMWLPKQLKEIFDKIVTVRRQVPHAHTTIIFDTLTDNEKEIVSKLILEAEEHGPLDSFDYLLMQFYKKQWKSLVRNVKLGIAHAQKTGQTDRVTHLLAILDSCKKKMLKRGIHE
jgi:DNA primase